MEEERIKVWCRGSKDNPRGVLEALLDAGLKLFDKDHEFANEGIKRNLSNPKVIFFSGCDSYQRPNFIGYYREDNLALIPIMDKWRQLQPKNVEHIVDLSEKWHPFSTEPILFDEPQHMKNILFWDGGSQVKMLYVSGRDFKAISQKLHFDPKYYADIKDFIPRK